MHRELWLPCGQAPESRPSGLPSKDRVSAPLPELQERVLRQDASLPPQPCGTATAAFPLRRDGAVPEVFQENLSSQKFPVQISACGVLPHRDSDRKFPQNHANWLCRQEAPAAPDRRTSVLPAFCETVYIPSIPATRTSVPATSTTLPACFSWRKVPVPPPASVFQTFS